MNNNEIIIAGAVIAIIISILAPFLASSNPDGLDKNLIVLVGGGNEEHAEEIIGDRMPIEYNAPMPDYSIEGLGKLGEVGAIVGGTLLMLGLSLAIGKVFGKKQGT
ncbi:MAG: PDGLE domain-containing protein [ANME-2 cluster archaeon]|jgi:cobalt/nickel transport protein|nr:PDGLE domain-containing protein [ANME-2 cluster archaeon]